jgi:predicted Ser/Thr protein kinase
VPDSASSSSDAELRAHVERTLAATYEIDRELGRGGMGIVYRARDKRLKRLVAIKLLPPELAFRSEIRSRFLREAETAAQLSHPNIVPIYSVDEKDGLVFFVMQFVDGDNLAKRIQETGPLDTTEVRRILRDVGDALALAHARSVIHRDIKPDNILLNKEDGRPMVTDFGIARAISDGADSRLTATGVAIGTPAYMSPEQCAGDRDVDGRADLYALGVVGYQMLTGELPFSATTTPALLVKQISEKPRPVSDRRAGVPDDLSRTVMRLLEKDPGQRYPTAAALVSALDSGVVPALPAASPGAERDAAPTASPPAWSVAPRSVTPVTEWQDAAAPTSDEMARWYAEPVVRFRKKLAPYLAVNAVIIVVAIFTRTSLLPITAFWSVWMAWRYAKIWSDGYDWRDVFKQPRHRLFFDVAAETVDSARAIFDRDKRAEFRERARRAHAVARASGAGGLFDGPGNPGGGNFSSPAAPRPELPAGPQAEVIRQSNADRDEIARLIATMPRADRDRVADVLPSANALADKVATLATMLADIDRNASPGATEVIDREIALLEGQANPLDRKASEERIRRLAWLKRQRRSVADMSARRERAAARLESCRVALQTMRFDVLRLRTGTQSAQGLTLMAEQALSLAREVDGVVYANDAVARLTSRDRV